MSKPLRIFIAVNIGTTPALQKLLGQLADMGRPLKAVSADHLHVTLKFLGDTDPVLLPDICRVLSAAVGNESVFEMPIIGLDAFPHLERPSVIWAGLNNTETLKYLVEQLEERLIMLGYPRESRAYHPHLTLARVRSPPSRELIGFINNYRETSFGIATVDAINVYQSELSSAGPRYTVLSSANLKE